MSDVELPNSGTPRPVPGRQLATVVLTCSVGVHAASLLQVDVPLALCFGLVVATVGIATLVNWRLQRVDPGRRLWSALREHASKGQRRTLVALFIYALLLPALLALTPAPVSDSDPLRGEAARHASGESYSAPNSSMRTRRIAYVVSGMTTVALYALHLALGIIPLLTRDSGHRRQVDGNADGRHQRARPPQAASSERLRPLRDLPSAGWRTSATALSWICAALNIAALTGAELGPFIGLCGVAAAFFFGATSRQLGSLWPDRRLHRVLLPHISPNVVASLGVALAYCVLLLLLGVLSRNSRPDATLWLSFDARSLTAMSAWLAVCSRVMFDAAHRAAKRQPQ